MDLINPINDARFYESLIKDPRRRTDEDVRNIFEKLRGLDMFAHLFTGPLTAICRSARYERHPAHHILFRKEQKATCWYILLSGSVLIESHILLPYGCFGAADRNLTAIGRCSIVTEEAEEEYSVASFVQTHKIPPPPTRPLPLPPAPTLPPPPPLGLAKASDAARDAFLRGERRFYAPLSDISEGAEDLDANNNDADFFSFVEDKRCPDPMSDTDTDKTAKDDEDVQLIEELRPAWAVKRGKMMLNNSKTFRETVASAKLPVEALVTKSALQLQDPSPVPEGRSERLELEAKIETPEPELQILETQIFSCPQALAPVDFEDFGPQSIYVPYFGPQEHYGKLGSVVLDSFEAELIRLQAELSFAARPLPPSPKPVPKGAADRIIISIHPSISPEKAIASRKASSLPDEKSNFGKRNGLSCRRATDCICLQTSEMIVMVFAVVPDAGTVVMQNNEKIDAWAVIVNGCVEVVKPSGERVEFKLGDSFGCEAVNSPDKLVSHLVEERDGQVDANYIDDFLLTYRVFIHDPVMIFEKLMHWFAEPQYRDRVARIVLLWVNNHYNDFETNREMVKLLERFEQALERDQMYAQQTLLNLACSVKARDEPMQFSVIGGKEMGAGIFVSDVLPDSAAEEAGLKRADEILEVNDQTLKFVTLQRAIDLLKGSIKLQLVVKNNINGFKASDTTTDIVRASKSNPDLLSAISSFYGPPKTDSPEHVLKIYRADQTFKYLPVFKETTAQNVVQLALQEFSMTAESGLEWALSFTQSAKNPLVIKQRKLPPQLENLAERISLNSRYYLKNNNRSEPLVPDDLASDVIKEAHAHILSLNAQVLAAQLTLQDFSVFASIEPTEYVDSLFKLESRYGWPRLDEFETVFNREMWWVATEVCRERSTQRRAKLVKKFIKVARHCRDLRNFNSMFAIVSGLDKPAVRRLHNTWERVGGKYSRFLEEIHSLIDPSRNMSKYRQHLALASQEPPVVPIFPVIKKDLTFLHEGNPTYTDKLVNFDKLRMIAREVRRVNKLSSAPYEIGSMAERSGGSVNDALLYMNSFDNGTGTKRVLNGGGTKFGIDSPQAVQKMLALVQNSRVKSTSSQASPASSSRSIPSRTTVSARSSAGSGMLRMSRGSLAENGGLPQRAVDLNRETSAVTNIYGNDVLI
ncbi:unnamed protein product, partial [Mesorhabditis spiculigera]